MPAQAACLRIALPVASRVIATVLLLAGAFAAGADDAAPTPAADREAMVRNELRQTLVRLASAGAFGERATDGVAMSLTLPAERFIDLGLLVDTRAAADDGVHVLGVTPGAGGHALGLRAGDVVRAIDGTTLAGLGRDAGGNANAVAVLKRHVDALPDQASVRLDVRRDGAPIALAGTLSAKYLPAVRLELGEGSLVAATAPAALGGALASTAPAAADAPGCGRISVFHVAPRSRQLYAVKLLQVDGKTAGTSLQETFRVGAGRHELLVSEQIDRRELPDTFTRQRSEWGRRTLTVDVGPDETLLIAAKLDDPRATDARYWQPVVWKTVSEPCR